MRIGISLTAAALVACRCGAIGEGRALFEKKEYSAALDRFQASLRQCDLAEEEALRSLSMAVRCLLELDRFSDADRVIRRAGELLGRRPDAAAGDGDAVALALFRSEHRLLTGQRALGGIQEAATVTYVALKLEQAIPWLEGAARELESLSCEDPEIARYLALRSAEIELELSRGLLAPHASADSKKKGKAIAAAALGRIARAQGEPLRNRFEKLEADFQALLK